MKGSSYVSPVALLADREKIDQPIPAKRPGPGDILKRGRMSHFGKEFRHHRHDPGSMNVTGQDRHQVGGRRDGPHKLYGGGGITGHRPALSPLDYVILVGPLPPFRVAAEHVGKRFDAQRNVYQKHNRMTGSDVSFKCVELPLINLICRIIQRSLSM